MKSFSVVLATSSGRSETLRQCLESIFANDYPSELFEVIVIDSGIDEKGLQVIEGFKRQHESLKFYSPGWGNVGPAKARNLGIKKAQNEIVAFTDDDCSVPPDWLQWLNDGYERHPEVAGVGGYLEAPPDILSKNIFAQYEKFHEWSQYNIKEQEFVSTKRDEAPFETNNISYKRTVLSEVGGFDERFPAEATGEDGDLKERVLARLAETSESRRGVLFVPVKVTHLQDYGLRRFWKQQLARGAGISLTKKKRGQRLESRPELVLKILLGPLGFLKYLIADGFKVKFALLDVIAFIFRQLGKFRFMGSYRFT